MSRFSWGCILLITLVQINTPPNCISSYKAQVVSLTCRAIILSIIIEEGDKAHTFKQVGKVIVKTEKILLAVYHKFVLWWTINTLQSQIFHQLITHTNHIGLRQHLASNNKILLDDDADLMTESYDLHYRTSMILQKNMNQILLYPCQLWSKH